MFETIPFRKLTKVMLTRKELMTLKHDFRSHQVYVSVNISFS